MPVLKTKLNFAKENTITQELISRYQTYVSGFEHHHQYLI